MESAARPLSRSEILARVAALAEAAGMDPYLLAVGHRLGFRIADEQMAALHALLDLLPSDDPVFQMSGPRKLPGARRATHEMRYVPRRW